MDNIFIIVRNSCYPSVCFLVYDVSSCLYFRSLCLTESCFFLCVLGQRLDDLLRYGGCHWEVGPLGHESVLISCVRDHDIVAFRILVPVGATYSLKFVGCPRVSELSHFLPNDVVPSLETERQEEEEEEEEEADVKFSVTLSSVLRLFCVGDIDLVALE